MQRQALKVKEQAVFEGRVTGNVEMKQFADRIRAMKFVLTKTKAPAPELYDKELAVISRATD